MLPQADLETRSHAAHATELRAWLRLLACSQHIEQTVSRRLRAQHGTTLPRFDLMAQLERHPEGLQMKELSARMMVSGGNVTGITDQLEAQSWVERVADPADRRAYRVRLTAAGKAAFLAMATDHEAWIVEAFAALNQRETDQLLGLLSKLKTHAAGLSAQPLMSIPPVLESSP
jgi:DNA-binding MarR family transcriptional regulator